MAKILIKCPRTDRYVFTGLELPADVFALLPEAQDPVFCPYCRHEHAWLRRDGMPIDPARWSRVPRAEDCLQRADEAADTAARATSLRQRELYGWMERTWLKLAEEFEFLAQMDRAHHVTGMCNSAVIGAPGPSHSDGQ